MPTDKMTLLFGDRDPQGVDLEDEDELFELLRETSPFPLDELAVALRAVLVRQILGEEPPLVWETARRLASLGIGRHAVLDQLSRALRPTVEGLIAGEPSEEVHERYEALLRALPLASEADIERVVKFLLSSYEFPTLDELHEQVLAELAIEEPAEAVTELVESVIERLLDESVIELLAGDVVVDPAQVAQEIVLTTRMGSGDDWPPLDTDFAGLCAVTGECQDPPAGALPGQLLQARLRGGELVVEPAAEPRQDGELVGRVRRAYAVESAETGLPITFQELTLRLVVDDPMAFDEPRLPLSELVAQAGLEIRGDLIGRDRETWRRLAHSRAVFRIVDRATSDEEREDAVSVYGTFERFEEGEPPAAAELRHVLDLMADEGVLGIITDQFFGYDEDPVALDVTEAFARRLAAAASRPLQRAVAGIVTAMVAERRCDPLAAAEALAEAVRQVPDFTPAVDRLAWVRSDQGRGSEAKALWTQVFSADYPDVVVIEEAMAGQGNPGAGMRRNEPCWCGSGRKYKVCHLRANELPPLPDRFNWMLRKHISYLERRGAPVDQVVFETAWRLSDGDPERMGEVMHDPILLDVVLHERGWFERFLAERGALLPEDEQLLYASWQLIPRTVYEIAGVRPGEGLTLRDVRTGDVTEVKERTFSRDAAAGQLICSRALPDGQGHQLVGAVLAVPPGREQAFLDILDDPDSRAVADGLLDYLAAAGRPPVLTTSEGEPLSWCTFVLRVDDPEHAREVLDRRYVSAGPDRWFKGRPSDPDGVVLASLELAGSELTVTAMSDDRMDDIQEELDAWLPDALVISDVRDGYDFAGGRAISMDADRPPADPQEQAALAAWLAGMEERWCAESVPALGGLTPREAAADPTRRETVIRLIDSLPAGGGVTDEGIVTMRPDRLRELLGI